MFSETVKATRRRFARAAFCRSLSSKASLEGLNILRRRYYGNERVKKLSHHCWVARRACKILYFYHIPRTGGGTLLNFFSRLGVDVQRFERSKYATEGSDLEQLQALDEDEHWKRVMDRVLNPGFHVIAHHVGRSGLLGMEERLASLRERAKVCRCELKSFTVMREPLLRDMSDVVARNCIRASRIERTGSLFARKRGYEGRKVSSPRAFNERNRVFAGCFLDHRRPPPAQLRLVLHLGAPRRGD